MQSEDKAKALEQFTDYFVKNYPGPDTIIFDPKWHAPKIFAAAYSAITAALVDVPAVEPVAWQHRIRPNFAIAEWGPWIDGRAPQFRTANYEAQERPLYTHPPHREGEDSAEVERMTRPIVGIEHRTAQEVFDIMADRIRLAATRSGSATAQKGGQP